MGTAEPERARDGRGAVTTYEKIAKGFEIFAQYAGHHQVTAEHDVLYAGPPPEKVSPEHIAFLETLGWRPDAYDEGFRKRV